MTEEAIDLIIEILGLHRVEESLMCLSFEAARDDCDPIRRIAHSFIEEELQNDPECDMILAARRVVLNRLKELKDRKGTSE